MIQQAIVANTVFDMIQQAFVASTNLWSRTYCSQYSVWYNSTSYCGQHVQMFGMIQQAIVANAFFIS